MVVFVLSPVVELQVEFELEIQVEFVLELLVPSSLS